MSSIPWLFLVCFLATQMPALQGQGRDVSAMTPNELAAAALASLHSERDELAHYTFLSKMSTYSAWEDGQAAVSNDYETDWTFLNGLPYIRSAKANGKPASAKDLVKDNAEQKQLAKSDPWNATSSQPASDELPASLATNFENRTLGRETLNGHDCIVLVSMPLPTHKVRNDQKRVRVWIDVETLALLRYETTWLSDVDTGRLVILAGSNGSQQFDYVHGVPLLVSGRRSERYRTSTGRVSVYQQIGHDSNYQRYTTSMTLTPVAEMSGRPSETSPAQPAGP